MKRVLLIARDMVGDLVNTTGAVSCLLEAFPNADFDLECGRAGAILFEGMSPRLRVIPRDRHGGFAGRLRRVMAYREGRYDCALILDPSRTRIRLAAWAGIPRVVGPVRRPGPIRHAELIDVSAGKHDLFPSLEGVLRAVGVEPSIAPRIPIQEDHRKWAEDAAGSARVGLFIGASDLAKRWPRWHELTPGNAWIAMCGPGEESLLEGLQMPKLPRPPNLLALAAVLERLDVLVTADTGPAHLAAAVGTPCVVLYGPTNPERYHPWPTNPPHELLRHPSPCEHYGTGCAFKEAGVCSQRCISANTPDEVLAAIERILSRRR
ncbi:MAG: glycosyltransferase family 9 protein [Methanoregulaceae archaeon]|nr:glycosyltransferase family 9 protein [Methanoregulaceae archaeon]